MGAVGKDLEDHLLPVDDRHAREFLPVALLRGGKRLVEHDHIRLFRLGEGDQFLRLAAAEQERRGGPPERHQLGARHRDAQVLYEFLQLREEFGRLAGLHLRRLDADQECAF